MACGGCEGGVVGRWFAGPQAVGTAALAVATVFLRIVGPHWWLSCLLTQSAHSALQFLCSPPSSHSCLSLSAAQRSRMAWPRLGLCCS